MSKIEEMALAYAFEGSGVDTTDYDLKKLESYKTGANAVLREIENVLVAANEQYTTKQAIALNTEIYNKIRELKGE